MITAIYFSLFSRCTHAIEFNEQDKQGGCNFSRNKPAREIYDRNQSSFFLVSCKKEFLSNFYEEVRKYSGQKNFQELFDGKFDIQSWPESGEFALRLRRPIYLYQRKDGINGYRDRSGKVFLEAKNCAQLNLIIKDLSPRLISSLSQDQQKCRVQATEILPPFVVEHLGLYQVPGNCFSSALNLKGFKQEMAQVGSTEFSKEILSHCTKRSGTPRAGDVVMVLDASSWGEVTQASQDLRIASELSHAFVLLTDQLGFEKPDQTSNNPYAFVTLREVLDGYEVASKYRFKNIPRPGSDIMYSVAYTCNY